MNIIVTGASQGIGYEAVKKLALSGHHHILAIARNREKLEGLQRAVEESGSESKVYPFVYDVVSAISDETLISVVRNHFEQVDVLINNAAFLEVKPFEQTTGEDLLHAYQVNVFGPCMLIQRLLPLLHKSQAAHVVNICSMAGFQSSKKFPGIGIYSSTKSALSTITECLAAEYTQSNIRFNALALGSVQTEMLGIAFPGLKAPLSAADMADFIANFALEGHRWFNGKVLPVSLSTP